MAPRSSTPEGNGAYGLALIAVDGKPPRAFAVGAKLDTDLVLQSVGLRTASLGSPQGARSVLLELPALPAPATGVLPPPGAAPAAPAPPPLPRATRCRAGAGRVAAGNGPGDGTCTGAGHAAAGGSAPCRPRRTRCRRTPNLPSPDNFRSQ